MTFSKSRSLLWILSVHILILCLFRSETTLHNSVNFPPHHREDNELVRVNLLKLHSYCASPASLPSLLLKRVNIYSSLCRDFTTLRCFISRDHGIYCPTVPRRVSGGYKPAKIFSPLSSRHETPSRALRPQIRPPECPRNSEDQRRMCPSDVQTHGPLVSRGETSGRVRSRVIQNCVKCGRKSGE